MTLRCLHFEKREAEDGVGVNTSKFDIQLSREYCELL